MISEADARLVLAPKTKAVYEFIHGEVTGGKPFPGLKTIATHFGWQSTSAAQDCLLRLVTYGKIKFEKNPQWGKFGGSRYIYSLAE